jgi:uncharacterized membrane protein
MKSNPLKFTFGIVLLYLLRLIPMPLPNFEPIMATTLPFAKKYGKIAGMLFPIIAIIAFDLITRPGMWTIYTAITYGMIGFAAGKYFGSIKKVKMRNYLGFGIAGTLAYDAITALVFGFQFGQPLAVTIIGQIPFTIYHLLGNALMIGILVPIINRAIIENPSMELDMQKAPNPAKWKL